MPRWEWDAVRQALAARAPERVEEPAAARAAVALVLRESPTGGPLPELLFIRRSEHPQDPWSGQMAFPGGRHEPGDDGLLETALRETREEVGLDLRQHAEVLAPLDEVRAMARLRPVNLVIAPFAFRLQPGAEARAVQEVRSVHWLPLERLLDPRSRARHDYVHEGMKLQFPCVRLEDIVIWGLTLRMFEAFTERVATCLPEPVA